MTLLNIITNIPTLAWLFPIGGAILAILFTKKNVATGKYDLPIDWKYVVITFAIGAALLLVISLFDPA